MPRKPRFFVPGLAAHIVQRGNNRQATFFEREDYELYLSLLLEGGDRYGCAIHAYVLMTNHVHILATPSQAISISRMMQYVGRHYVPYINKKYRRSGTLWEGRFKASVIDTSDYLLACYRYIELNPVRAGMVDDPRGYRWSSFRYNGLGEGDALIAAHEEYDKLGKTRVIRAQNYRKIFELSDCSGEVSALRQYTQSGTPLGNAKFTHDIESELAMKVGQAIRGRPKRNSE